MPKRRGAAAAGLAAGADQIGSLIDQIIKASFQEQSQARQAKYAAGQADANASRQLDRDATLLFARDPEAAERQRGPIGSVDPTQFVRPNNQRMGPLLNNINSGTTPQSAVTPEILQAGAMAQGLPTGPEFDALRAAMASRTGSINTELQNAENKTERILPGGAVKGFIGRQGDNIVTERTGQQEGERSLDQFKFGEGSDLGRKLKGQLAFSEAHSREGGTIEGRWDHRTHLIEVEKELAAARAQGKPAGQLPTMRMLAKQMVDLSDVLNQAEGGPATLMQNMNQAGQQFLHLNDDRKTLSDLIEGFVPIFARMVGHTGVLTQKDVDSVKRILPSFGLSKTEGVRRNQNFMKFIEVADRMGSQLGEINPNQSPQAQSAEFLQRMNMLQGMMGVSDVQEGQLGPNGEIIYGGR